MWESPSKSGTSRCMGRTTMFRLVYYSACYTRQQREIELSAEDMDCAHLWRRRPIARAFAILAVMGKCDRFASLPRLASFTQPLQRTFDRWF
eukprot:2277511-Pyramimonas_sp.AAC.1